VNKILRSIYFLWKQQLKFEGKYVVVPRPNAATISADKMNVVYRGVVRLFLCWYF
jgi:hypothetical protein